MNFFLFFIFISLTACSQSKIELKLKDTNQSEFTQYLVDGKKLYVLDFEKEIGASDSMYFVLFKIDLNSKKIVNKTKIKDAKIYTNPVLKKEKNSLLIINEIALEDLQYSYNISEDFKKQEKIALSILNHIKIYNLTSYLDLKNNLFYQNYAPIKYDGFPYVYINEIYAFESNDQKNIKIFKNDGNISFEKKYPYISLHGYENEFREYSKYRKLSKFYLSKNKIFVFPNIDENPVEIDNGYVLTFNRNNGNLEQNQKINSIKNAGNCVNIITFDDRQYTLTHSQSPIKFGVDKSEDFCTCNAKNISENFDPRKIIKIINKTVYIGHNVKSKTVEVIFK